MLHILEREMEWRKKQGRPEGFDTLRAHKPVIAVGAQQPLDDQKMLADYFRMYSIHTFFEVVTELIAIRWEGRSRRNSFHRKSHLSDIYTSSNFYIAPSSRPRGVMGTSF